MSNNESPRYDVKDEEKDPVHFLSQYDKVSTVRDNETGKEYSGYGHTPQEARDHAFEQAARDRND